MKDSLTLGNPGRLSKSDMWSIHEHFNAIVSILERAGMDKVHVFEFLMSLGHSWWMSNL